MPESEEIVLPKLRQEWLDMLVRRVLSNDRTAIESIACLSSDEYRYVYQAIRLERLLRESDDTHH